MNQLLTTGIILRRTDYGEADRIIVLLTPQHGKLSLVAKGVRKVKSKLAGGIELFSISDITYLAPRSGSGLGTLVSARLITHFNRIVQDIDRTMLGYDLIKRLDKNTEDNPEPAYFELLEETFQALNDAKIGRDLIGMWFTAQLLRLSGHTPNLQTDTAHAKLEATGRYEFDYDASTFAPRPDGPYDADAIKFLRLLFSPNRPAQLQHIQGVDQLVPSLLPLVQMHGRLNLGNG